MASSCGAKPVSDSSKITQPVFTLGSYTPSGVGACYYYASDYYAGTDSVGAGSSSATIMINAPITPLTDATNSLALSWSAGTSSAFNTAVTCTGYYYIVFTIEFETASSSGYLVTLPPSASPSITIYPCVQTTDGTTVLYGGCPAGSNTAIYATLNPQCNGGNYCGKMQFNFAKTVYLTQNQKIAPPSIKATSKVTVTGGRFIAYYLHS